MQCPIDQTELVMTDRQGVEIDYCPTCRGVWLDRGELDKIIDRSQGATASAAPATPVRTAPPPAYADNRVDSYGRKRKREGFLSDIFDFD